MKTKNKKSVKSVAPTAQEVAQTYKDLQSYFQEVYRAQQLRNNSDSIKKLDELRAKIVSAVTNYQKNPSNVKPLSQEIASSAKILSELSEMKVPSNLAAEIAKMQPSKPLPKTDIPKKEVKEKVTDMPTKELKEKIKHPLKAEVIKKDKPKKSFFGFRKKHEVKQESKEDKKELKVSHHDKKKELKVNTKPEEHKTQKIQLVASKERVAATVQKAPKGELLQTYEVESNDAKIKVKIIKEPLVVSYNVFIPEIKPPTAMLLNDLRNELITITNISMKELTDPKSFNKIKQKFTDKAVELIKEKLPHIELETQTFLIGQLIQDMLGLGKIEYLINDPNLEEIVIQSSKEPVRVYTKKYGWLSSNIKIEKEEDIINYANIIARRVGRQINILSPLLDAHLVTGDRINAVLYPISSKGNNITIRKFARDPYTIIDLINSKTCDLETATLIWLAIEYEMNVIISGGTASGKTVFLNACMPFIPPNQKILSIEDTRELMLPEFLYWDPLVTRTPNPEGKGEVSMLHLLVNSLRMRPDRIILGEMRKHDEAMVLFEAMHTGHSVYATVHAESGAETVSRLVNPPLSVPANLLKAVNLNVIMFRDRRKGIRRVLQIAEFDADGNSAKANIIYRWIPEEDKIIRHSENTRFFEDIGRHTGMTQSEIKANLEDKKAVLEWMIKHKIRDLRSFGEIMNYFYRNKELLKKAMKKNDPKMLLKNGVPKDTREYKPKEKESKKEKPIRSKLKKEASKTKTVAKKKTAKKKATKKKATKKRAVKKKVAKKKVAKKKSHKKSTKKRR